MLHLPFINVLTFSRQNNVKKPKESKRSTESSSKHSDGKLSVGESIKTSNPTSSNNIVNSHSSLLNEVKTLLSSSNSIVPNLKETSVTVIPTAKSDDAKALNSDTSKPNTSPSFGSNLTITPIGVNDKSTAKPLASVQNQVNNCFDLDILSTAHSKMIVTCRVRQFVSFTVYSLDKMYTY